MADQIWVNEGLMDELISMVTGIQGSRGSFNIDLVLTPAPPFNNLNTFGGSTFGVGSGAFSAVSLNASGTNVIESADVVPVGVLGNVALAQAQPVTFTNISGAPVLVNGIAMVDPSATIPSGTPLIMNIAALDTGPVTIPNGGTITIPVILGDSSQLLT